MNARLMISLTVYLLATSSLFAQEERQDGGPQMSSELRQVIDDCHISLNIPRPEHGQRKERGSEPTSEDLAKMKEMDSNFQKIRACVVSKGYSMPDRPARGEGGHHRSFQQQEQDSSEANDSSISGTAQ